MRDPGHAVAFASYVLQYEGNWPLYRGPAIISRFDLVAKLQVNAHCAFESLPPLEEICFSIEDSVLQQKRIVCPY
jgi:hypothetical protein